MRPDTYIMQGRRSAVLVAGILLGLLGLASARSIFHPQPIEDGASPRKMMEDGSFTPGFWSGDAPGRLGNNHPRERMMLATPDAFFRGYQVTDLVYSPMAFRDANQGGNSNDNWTPINVWDEFWARYAISAAEFADDAVSTRPDLVIAMFGSDPNVNPYPVIEQAAYQEISDTIKQVKLTLTFTSANTLKELEPREMVVVSDNGVPQHVEFNGVKYTPKYPVPTSEGDQAVGLRSRNRGQDNKNDKWNTIRVGDKLWDKYAFGGGDFADTVLSTRPDLIKAMYGSDPQIRPSPVVDQASYQNQAKNLVLVKLKLIYTSGLTDRDLPPQEVKVLFANDVPQWLDFKGEQYSPMLRAPGGISGDNSQNINNGQNSNNGQNGNDQWITLDRSHKLWNMAEQAGQFAVRVLNNKPNLQRDAVNGDGRGVRYESLDLAKVQFIDGSPTIEFRITIIISLRDWQGNFGRQTVRTRVLYAGGNFQWAEWAQDQFSLQ